MSPKTNNPYTEQEKQQFDDLLKRHREKLIVHLYRILDHHGHLEEVLQETIYQACLSFFELEDKDKFPGWISRIATNVYCKMKRDHLLSQKAYESYHDEKRLSSRALSESGPVQKSITKEDCHAAHEIWISIPVEDREFFTLHDVEKYTISEVAKLTETPERTVKYHLARARKYVSSKTKDILIVFLTLRLLQPDDGRAWNNAYAQFQVAMETSLPETAPVVLETAANNASQVAETATAGAGAAATAVSSMSSVLMAAAMPFVWVMSVLFGGQACGLALVYHTPTIPLRRWLVKHLFYCYSAIVIVPILFLFTGRIVDNVYGWESRIAFTFVYNALFVLFAFFYLLTANRHYRKIWNGKKTVALSFESLSRLIRRGFVTLTVILLVFFLLFLKVSIFPDYQVSAAADEWDRCVFIVIATLVLALVLTCIHVSMFFLFRYYLSISTDDSAVYPIPTNRKSWSYRLLWEIAYMAIFVILTLAPALLHLCLKNTRPVCAVLELACFSLCWGGVLSFNMKKPGYRWWLIIPVFIVLIAIMATLRSTIYE